MNDGQPTDAPPMPQDAPAPAPVVPAAAQRVPVITGEGVVQTVAAHDVPAALDQGWTVATPEQVAAQRDEDAYGNTAAQARAAGEGAMRGLTVGLSDAAMVKLGIDPTGLRKRAEQNPVLAGVGEAAGFVAPLLASGGTAGAAELVAKGAGEVAGKTATRGALGLGMDALRVAGAPVRGLSAVGKAAEKIAGKALGESILARGATQAVSGAVEGGLYGAGQAISESAINDAPLTAERIAAHVGTGALFGGAAGGLFGTVGAGLSDATLPTIKKLVNAETVQSFVDRAGLRQFAQGRGKQLFAKLRRDFGNDAESVIGRTMREEGLDEVVFSGKHDWNDISAITKDKLGSAGRRIGDDLREIDKVMPEQGSAAAQRSAQRIADDVLEPLRHTGVNSDKGIAAKIQRNFEGLFPSPELGIEGPERVGSFEQLHKLRQRIDELAFPKSPTAEATPYQKSLQKMRGVIEEEITKGADGASELLASQGQTSIAANYSADKTRWRALNWMDTAAQSNAASELANRTVSLTDNIWGSTMTAATLARLASGDVGAIGSLALAAISGGGAALLNKALREQGQGAAARMGQRLVKVMSADAAIGKEATAAADTFFTRAADTAQLAAPVTAARVSTPANMTLAEHFDERRKRLEGYAAAPQQRMANALQDADQYAPTLSAQLTGVTDRAAQFLQSKLPLTPINPYDAQPLLKKHSAIPDSAKMRFIRYSHAVEHPMEGVRAFANGNMSNEQAEVLRTVYPRLHDQIAQRVAHQLASSTKRLSRGQLVQISRLLGQPVHASQSPEFISACQAVHAASRDAMQQAASPRPLPDRSDAQSSASQRIEASL